MCESLAAIGRGTSEIMQHHQQQNIMACRYCQKGGHNQTDSTLPVECLLIDVRIPLDSITASSIVGNSSSATWALASNSAAAAAAFTLLASTSDRPFGPTAANRQQAIIHHDSTKA